MKKLLAIFGGPRRNSNTEILLNGVLDCIDKSKIEVERVILGQMDIFPCTSCYGCGSTGICVLKDDMRDIYDKIRESDIIVLASPIYFGNVTAQAKEMIDRCQAFWSSKYLANLRSNRGKKWGFFIATAGSTHEEAFRGAEYTVKLFFASCDAVYEGKVFIDNTDNIPVESNKDWHKKVSKLCSDINNL